MYVLLHPLHPQYSIYSSAVPHNEAGLVKENVLLLGLSEESPDNHFDVHMHKAFIVIYLNMHAVLCLT